MWEKTFAAIVIIFLFLGVFYQPIMDGIKGLRTEDTTDNLLVTTAAGVTTANVTLSRELFQAALSELITLTSTNGDDTPVGIEYTESTQRLLVAGLDDDSSRTLTINYNAETDQSVMRIIGPFLGILIFLGVIGKILWDWKKH